jgi:hypothetical protein
MGQFYSSTLSPHDFHNETKPVGATMAVTGSEYQKQQDANGCVFSVTPAKAPKFVLMAIGGAVLALLGLVLGPLGWLFFLPVGIFGIWLGYFRDGRPPAHRESSSFRVSATAIEANGRTFPKDDIHRLIIKNGVTNDIVGAPNVVIPVNTSTALGIAHRAKVATVANALEVETGGKGYFLAGGMDQTTAFGLLHDVSKVLGFSTT